MEAVIEIIKDMNIGQLIAMGIMFWVANGRVNNKIEKIDEKLTNTILKLESKVDKLSDKVEDIDRRLCRIEGSLATKGHCLIENSTIQRKAE